MTTIRTLPFALLAILPALGSAQGQRDFADVVRAEPIVETIAEPREVCNDRVETRVERGGNNGAGGTIVGALVGAAVGNQVGSGNGRRAATVAGAVAGGAIGGNLDRRNDRYVERDVVRTRCHVVEETSERTVGWDVTYRYAGRTYSTQLDRDPGRRLPVFVSVEPES